MSRNGPGTAVSNASVKHYLEVELYERVRADASIFDFLHAGSLDGIWYLDLEQPGQGWMSPRYKEVLGYRDDEVPNTAAWWRQNAFAEDLAPTLDNFQRHCADPSVPFDQVVRHRHKNGSTVWVRCRGMAIRDESGKPIRMIGAHTDITAMKLTEERLRALYEGSPDMYFVAEAATGLIHECNQALALNTGQPDIVGRTLGELCGPESSLIARDVLRELQSHGQIQNVELKLKRMGGDALPVLLSANTAEENGRTLVRGWCRDISHLKRFSNMQVLLAALPSGVLLADERGVILSSNPTVDQMLGYGKGELEGRSLSSVLVNDQGIKRDGSALPVHMELNTLRLGEGEFQVATLSDLSARQGIEMALRESEHRFRQLTESLPQVVWTCTAEGVCDYLSPQWVEYTGMPADAYLDRRQNDAVHPDDREKMREAWEAALREGRAFQFDLRLRRRDGMYRWFDVRAIPLRNVSNRIVKWFGSSTDVHESRETRLELERERKRLASLVTLAPAVFCSFAQRADGTAYFPYASPQVLDLYGLSAEDLREDAGYIFGITHAGDLKILKESMQESAQTLSAWNLQFRINHATKGQRWIEGHSVPESHADGTVVWHGFLTDITERKQVEADQRFLMDLGAAMQTAANPADIAQQATRMVAEYVDVAKCNFWSVDAARTEATLLHEHARTGTGSKPGVCQLADWMTSEFIADMAVAKVFAINNAAEHPASTAKYESMFRAGGCEALLTVPLRRGGLWVGLVNLTHSEPRQWTEREKDLARSAAERIWPAYEAARAVEAERHVHQSLAASEHRLRLALEASSIGIWEYDATTKERSWDARCRAIYGFPADLKLTDDIVTSCIHPEDREGVDAQARALRPISGRDRFEVEYRVVTWNGAGIRHVRTEGQMLVEGEGEPRQVRAIGTMQDMTALKQSERALRRVNLELEQFAYAAAHDLQEPLRNVGLATQVLASKYMGKFNSEADRLLEIAVEGPLRMQAMVKDLLAYSRALTLEENTTLVADGNEVLATAIRNLEVAIREKDAQIHWDRLPKVSMSELHLTQLFQNLIGNSLKYAGERQPQIQVSAERLAGEWLIAVKDNGIGMAPEHHDRAFGVFKRLHNRDVPGTGIGLALCKRIVEHYGGRIWIESEVDEGTKVLFTAPAGE